MLEQKFNYRAMSVLYSLVQRCVVELPGSVNRCTAPDQCFDVLQISSKACHVKGTVSEIADLIYIIQPNFTEFREFFIFIATQDLWSGEFHKKMRLSLWAERLNLMQLG
jgi:hypothetical protein